MIDDKYKCRDIKFFSTFFYQHIKQSHMQYAARDLQLRDAIHIYLFCAHMSAQMRKRMLVAHDECFIWQPTDAQKYITQTSLTITRLYVRVREMSLERNLFM